MSDFFTGGLIVFAICQFIYGYHLETEIKALKTIMLKISEEKEKLNNIVALQAGNLKQ